MLAGIIFGIFAIIVYLFHIADWEIFSIEVLPFYNLAVQRLEMVRID